MFERKVIYSNILNTNISFNVITPNNYNEMSSYPVLYLLHGKGQDYLAWIKYSTIELIAEDYPYIIVMPDKCDAWSNWSTEDFYKYEKSILELVDFVDKNYKTINSKLYRGISGVSLGGYTAYLLSFLHSDKFSSVSALSTPMNIKNFLEKNKENFKKINIEEFDSKFNIFKFARNEIVNKMKMLFDSGVDDKIAYDGSCEFHEFLNNHDIEHVFDTGKGGHDWYYWNDNIEKHLKFHLNNFSKGCC